MNNNYSITTKVSWAQTLRELENEFRLWGVDEWATNTPRGARWEGYRIQDEIDRTVRLTYYRDGQPINLEMGKQARAVDNLRVIFLAIQAMRLNEKRGVGEVMQSAYLQLAGGVGPVDPYQLLQVSPSAPIEVIEASYKALTRKAHPDAGGSEAQQKQLNDAIAQIRKERGL